MFWATWLVLALVGVFLAAWAGLMIWGIRTGQFRRIEDAKYRIFEEEVCDHEQWK